MGKAKRIVTAAFPPFSKHGPPEPPQPGVSQQKRDIPKDHPFDPRALKPMSKALWASSVALGHALTAYRHFTRLKSATVSPDGRLGGRGYVMGMQEIRQNLYEVCERLSSISDTLFDEISAPHWQPKLAMLDEEDAEDVGRFVEESQEVLENPEEAAEEDMEAIEEENDEPKHKKPSPEEETKGSELPGGGAPETSEAVPSGAAGRVQGETPAGSQSQLKQASVRVVSRFVTRQELQALGEQADPEMVAAVEERSRRLSEKILQGMRERGELEASTEPVEGLPGPRVTDWAEGDGPFGSFNPPEDATDDEWGIGEGAPADYAYESEWENDMSHHERGLVAESEAWAESVLPSDGTPTEAWDFGLGYGARGQGAGDYANPTSEGRGVWGPRSGLPGGPNQSSGDVVAPIVDVNINERHGEGLLPGDTSEPVARRDEYEGPKGNLVQTMWAEPLPTGESAPAEVDIPIDIDTGYVHEDLDTPWLPLEAPGTNLPPGTPGTRVE
jgi:hypothetical protein